MFAVRLLFVVCLFYGDIVFSRARGALWVAFGLCCLVVARCVILVVDFGYV